jgi:sporulation protein YlmC with PRC-barrel domain
VVLREGGFVVRKLLSASTLRGDRVVNLDQEDLGYVEDLMLDLETGRVAYAVLCFGGFLGVGDKLFAIPWDVLRVDTEQQCFVINVAKDRLEEAPGFDKDHWPDMADLRWRDAIRRYYLATR